MKAPRGTFDVLPEDWPRRTRVEEETRRILERAGYRRIETPIFEETGLFARGVGEATDIVQKEMYTFDDAGGRSLTLRPEGTAPIMRAYLEHGMHKRPAPVKLWYLGPFFRYERAQAGRYREFWQVGAEAIGSDDPALDAELIILLAEIMEAVGVEGIRVRIGSLGTPETRRAYRDELISYLRDHEDQLSEEVRGRIDLNPLRAFDADHPGTRAVMAAAPRLLDRLDGEDAEHFTAVRELLDGAGLPYEIDTTLVRGLDYYTRTVFEFTSDALGAQSGVGGGGRYDGLAEQIGAARVPGVGWAAGVERILLGAPEFPAAEPVVDLYVVAAQDDARATAFRLAAEARRAGLGAHLEAAGRSVKGAFKHADRLGARYVAVLGDGGVALKHMDSGEQEDLPPERVIPRVLRAQM